MSVLNLFKQSGDAHIGQTLTRLARLAQAAHQYELAMRQGQRAVLEGALDRALDGAIHDASAADDVTEAPR